MDQLIVCLPRESQDASVFLALFSYSGLMLRSAALFLWILFYDLAYLEEAA